MKNTKYTPGPWRIGKLGRVVVADHPIDNGNRSIGHNDTKYYGGHLIAESIWRKEDSNLISAAPELYESLWGLLEWYDDGVATFEPDCPPELATIWKKAKEALAKANGGIL